MNTSTNDKQVKTGGAFADGLTLIRFLLTPIVMLVILNGWPANQMAILASVLFTIAALTDIFDDLTGGASTSRDRSLGWFDDIADTVLVTGSLAAMLWVVYQSGQLGWAFGVPALVLIGREVIVALVKGRSLIRREWPVTSLGNLRTFLTMLSVCLLIASPWLTTWIDSIRASDENIMGIYDSNAGYVWITGQVLLWLAALLSVYTGIQILFGKSSAANDA